MKKNGALDIIFKILSVFLCIALVPTIILTVFIGTISSIVRPETIIKTVQSVDVQQVVTEVPEVSQMLEEAEIQPELVEKIVESETVEQLLSSYAQDLSNYLVTGETSFDKETIKSIINSNRAEVQQILHEVAPEDVTYEDIEKELDTFIEETIVPLLDESLPKAETIVEEVPAEFMEAFKLLNNGTITKFCIIVCAVLAALILLLRLRECSFLIWHSVVAIISGIFVALFYFGIKTIFTLAPGDLPLGQETIQTIITALTQNMLISFIVLFVIATVFITISSILKKARINRSTQEG